MRGCYGQRVHHPRMAWILSLADLAPWGPRARRGRPCGSRSCDREV